MKGIVEDVNLHGQMRVLMHIMESQEWRDMWLGLNLSLFTFADLGLEETSTDKEIWHVCQRVQVVLITGNRNKRDPESLEATI